MNFKSRSLYLLLITIPTLIFDQWTKIWAVDNLKGQASQSYFFDLVKFIYAENPGAWGSLGSDWPELARTLFLIVLPLLILIGIAIYVLISKNLSKVDIISMSCIFAGGMGNLIDRIRYDYVVDMLYIGYGKIGTNIFNIADVVIMTGFGIMVVFGMLLKKKES